MIKNFIDELKLYNRQELTIYKYEQTLKLLDVENLTFEEITQKIINNNHSATYQRYLKAVYQSYLNFLEDTEKIKKLKKVKLKHLDVVFRDVISKDELMEKTEILKTDSSKDIFWKTVIRFLFQTGIRVSEINNLSHLNNKLYVIGKGNKKREIFYNKKTFNLLTLYQSQLKNKIQSASICKNIKKYLNNNLTPHSLRRSFATYFLKSGVDIKLISQQLGHSDVATTYRYVHITREENLKIYNKLMND
ncbi:tyrosine-type recombinase/integrase [Mesomycoplasma lagogenitalium]|uniref:Tyrosine-type recombinase/integrase n=1 Tax=Mesomycoplasma lagogenitalium TaxID=171286 RepID=A0ABY8LWJ3_9BACT|nr:tyrosine-type recombinase/integrase [Mesomycoplasma lagogenitalium]WGI36492.1 tyrosine-type recombinase/integrase [Mesomycoplasma lagogenitalium]